MTNDLTYYERYGFAEEILLNIFIFCDLPTLKKLLFLTKQCSRISKEVYNQLFNKDCSITFNPENKIDYDFYGEVIIPIEHASNPRAINLGTIARSNKEQTILIKMKSLWKDNDAFIKWCEVTDKNFGLVFGVSFRTDTFRIPPAYYDIRISFYCISSNIISHNLLKKNKVRDLIFNGNIISIDPKTLAKCKRLKRLSITDRNEYALDADNAHYLNEMLKELKSATISLEHLSVGHYGAQSILDIVTYISSATKTLKIFKMLDYRSDYTSDAQMMEQSFTKLLASLSECKQLYFLLLQYEFTPENMGQVFKLIQQNKAIKLLHLNFYGEEIKAEIFPSLKQIICDIELEEVNINGQFNQDQLNELAESIHKNKKLKSLKLDCIEQMKLQEIWTFKNKCSLLNIEFSCIDKEANEQLNNMFKSQNLSLQKLG